MELLFRMCTLLAFKETFQMDIEFEYFFQCFNPYFHPGLEPCLNMLISFRTPSKVLKFLKAIEIQNSILSDLSFQWFYHFKILSLLNNSSHKSIFMVKFYQDIFFHFKIYVHSMIIDFIMIQNLLYSKFFSKNLKVLESFLFDYLI